MSKAFVLSSGGDDALLAAKILIRNNPEAVHLSASRKTLDFNSGSDLTFIRPYFPVGKLIGNSGLAKSCKCTVYDYTTSDWYQERERLEREEVECHWVDPANSICKYVWGTRDPLPLIVALTHDYTKWLLTTDKSIYLYYGMMMKDGRISPEGTKWYLSLLNGDPEALHTLLSDGEVIASYVKGLNTVLAGDLVFEDELYGHKVLVANMRGTDSLVAKAYGDTDADAVVLYSKNHGRGEWQYSIYQLNPEVDVSEIARKLGGGGTPGAAGWRMPKLIFKNYASSCNSSFKRLLGAEEAPVQIDEYIKHHLLPKSWHISRVKYKDKSAALANTPYLTHQNPFSGLNVFNEEIGVTYCITATGEVRVATRPLKGQELDDSYGDRLGPYWITIMPMAEFTASLQAS